MTPDQEEHQEEQFHRLLIATDNALAAGTPGPPVNEEAPAELRPRLERQIAWCRRVRRLLPTAGGSTEEEGSTPAPVKAQSSTVQPSIVTPLSSTGDAPLAKLGRFQIRRELGRGGCGIVFLAFDPDLGHKVALKVPRPEAVVIPELRARFQQEARVAAGLDHPNLVPVYETGEHGAICYIASAFCPGVTLSAWLRERTESVAFDLAARLLATLAEAVEHAHRRGILHRDLKPGNIMLSVRSQGSGVGNKTPRLLTPGSSLPNWTSFRESWILAWPSFSKPKPGQSLWVTKPRAGPSSARPITCARTSRRSQQDHRPCHGCLWSGRHPIRSVDRQAAVSGRQRRQDAAAGADGGAGVAGPAAPDVPRDLETICLKCLHKDPGKRYASARRWPTIYSATWLGSRSRPAAWGLWAGRSCGAGATRAWPPPSAWPL